jgi:hypothetical protein
LALGFREFANDSISKGHDLFYRDVEPIAKGRCRLFAFFGGQLCHFDTTERFGLSLLYEPVRCAPIHFDDPQELAQLP